MARKTPKVPIQHAVGIAEGKVKGDDGTAIEVPDVIKGDEGMVEWNGSGYDWTLFEAAPRPSESQSTPEPQKAAGGRREGDKRIQVVAPPVETKPAKNRPAQFEHPATSEIVDDQTYRDAALPGILIHNLHRDGGGVWTCQLTVNEETFDLIRHGGWQIRSNGTAPRAAKPGVAAAIQARVAKLEKEHKGDPEENGNGEEQE